MVCCGKNKTPKNEIAVVLAIDVRFQMAQCIALVTSWYGYPVCFKLLWKLWWPEQGWMCLYMGFCVRLSLCLSVSMGTDVLFTHACSSGLPHTPFLLRLLLLSCFLSLRLCVYWHPVGLWTNRSCSLPFKDKEEKLDSSQGILRTKSHYRQMSTGCLLVQLFVVLVASVCVPNSLTQITFPISNVMFGTFHL